MISYRIAVHATAQVFSILRSWESNSHWNMQLDFLHFLLCQYRRGHSGSCWCHCLRHRWPGKLRFYLLWRSSRLRLFRLGSIYRQRPRHFAQTEIKHVFWLLNYQILSLMTEPNHWQASRTLNELVQNLHLLQYHPYWLFWLNSWINLFSILWALSRPFQLRWLHHLLCVLHFDQKLDWQHYIFELRPLSYSQ